MALSRLVETQTVTRRKTFERDGFVTVQRFCDTDELRCVENTLNRFIGDGLNRLPPEHVFFEDKSAPATLKQIQCLHVHDTFLGAFMNDRPRQLAEELLGEPVKGMNLQYFNKPPAHNLATPPHQDGFYFMLEPCRALTMWMALDAVDGENGCIRYVRGSHIQGMRPHARTQTLGFSQGISDFGQAVDSANEVACPAEPGDLLAHHALTIHRADANVSAKRTRRALGFIFYGASARENGARHEAYQADLATELAKAKKI